MTKPLVLESAISASQRIHFFGKPSRALSSPGVQVESSSISREHHALVRRGDLFVRGAHQGELLTFLNALRRVGGGFGEAFSAGQAPAAAARRRARRAL